MLTPGAEKEPAKIIEAIARHQVSTMHFVPSMLAAFLGYIQKAPLQEETKSLRQVFASGEALGLVQVQQFFGHINNPTTALHNLYGPTEASIDVSYFDCHTLGNRNMVPIGKPIDNIQLHIINEQKELTPLGIAGELCISGVGLSRGYLNNPILTAEKFIPSPFKEGERLYKTGDLARWLPDGNIEFLGRIDFQLKIRGYRIEAGEIEQALLSHPSIHHCTVVGKTINKDTELVAYIVAKEAMDLPDVVQLRNFLKEGLPSYMIPSHFVELAEMPLTTSGKVNRKALPAPDASGLATGTNYMAPRNDMEQQLVIIWEEILGRKTISVTDDFFDLGGHSLKAIRLLGQIQEQLKLQFPLQLLFQHSVLSEQAAQLQLLSQHENTTTYQEGVRFNPTAEQTVFTFPPFFGLSAWYQQLASQLADVSFYCFDFLLEANRLEVYYQQIKKQQATGPYVLFGYSAGGSLAYEMAAYMEAQGDVVAAVVMGDSMIVSNMKTDLEGYLNDLSTALSTRQDDSAKGLLELIQHPTLRAQSKQRLAAYESFLNQVGNLAIQADIHLIKAEFEASIATMHQRWNEYTKGDYNEYQASGSHDYLFEAPNLQANGAMLQGIFEKSLVKEIK